MNEHGLTDDQIDELEIERTEEYHDLHKQLSVLDATSNYDPDFNYVVGTDELAQLTEGAVWTIEELTYRVRKGLFSESFDTETRIETHNVIGRNVTLTASYGVGADKDTMTIDLSGGIAGLTDSERIALSTAERDDVNFDGNIIVVTPRDDLDVLATSSLTITANNRIFLGSEQDININQVGTNDKIRIKGSKGIFNVAVVPDQGNITGSDLILEAADGSIGSKNAPIHIDLMDDASFTARAGQNIYIEEEQGNLHIDTVFASNHVHLVAGQSIRDAFATDDLNIHSESLYLKVGESVGTNENFLDIRLDSDGELSTDAQEDVYIRSEGLLNVENITSNIGNVTLKVNEDLLVLDSGTITTGEGSVTLQVGDNVTIEGLVNVAEGIFIYGDYYGDDEDADPGIGSKIEISSQISAPSAKIIGGIDDDVINLNVFIEIPITLQTKKGDDLITFKDYAGVTGLIDAGKGFDTLNYSDYTLPVLVNRETRQATGIDGYRSVEKIIGGKEFDTVIGKNTDSQWHITGQDKGYIDGQEKLMFHSFENLTGGTADDHFVFSDGQWLSGGVRGDSGDDLTVGNDTMDFSVYTNSVEVDLERSLATIINRSDGKENSITGNFSVRGIENVIGGEGDDVLVGDAQANRLVGNGGDDILDGRSGDDTLIGGAGFDTTIGGDGIDLVDYSHSPDGVNATLGYYAYADGNGSQDRLTGIENLRGSEHADRLTGTSGDNQIEGLGGDDVIDGSDGADILFGGAGDDLLLGGFADDVLLGEGGNDALAGGGGNDILDGGAGKDTTYASKIEPIAYWNFDETDGSTVADSSGSPQDGIFFGQYPDLDNLGPNVPFAAKTGADFHRTTKEYIAVAHDQAFQVDNGTIQLWFNTRHTSGSGHQALFSKDHAGYVEGGHLNIRLSGSRIEVRLQDENESYTIRTGKLVKAGTWHHLAFSFGEGGMKLYLDGDLVGEDGFTGGLTANREAIVIGGSNWGNRDDTGDLSKLRISNTFNGHIDEVAFYGQTLDAEQVRQLATRGPLQVSADTKDAGLSGRLEDYRFSFVDDSLQVTDTRPASPTAIAYWNFNETGGSTVADGVGTPQNGIFFARNTPDLDDLGPSVTFDTETGADFHRTPKNYIAIAHDPVFELDSGTVQLWFNTRRTGQQALFSKDHSGFVEGGHLNIQLSGSRIEARLQGENESHTIRTGELVHKNTWHHLAFSFGEDGMKLYLDSELVGQDDFTGGLTANQEAIVIGGSNWGNRDDTGDLSKLRISNPFSGHIDEVAIFSGALTQEEIHRSKAEGPQRLIDETSPSETIDGTDQYRSVEHLPFVDDINTYVLDRGSENPSELSVEDVHQLAGFGRLVVLGDDTQPLRLLGAWGREGTETLGGNSFVRYSSGPARLLVSEGVTVKSDQNLMVPIAYWSFNEMGGKNVADSAGSPQDGTFFGPRPDLDDPGPNVNFAAKTGADFHRTAKEYIAVGHAPVFELDSGTIQLWFNTRHTSGQQALFSKDHNGFGDGGHLNIRLDGERLEARLQGAAESHTIRTDKLVHAGTWHHLAFSFGDDGMKLYLDGELVGQDDFTGGLTANREAIVIGGSNWGNRDDTGDLSKLRISNPFNGHIDEVAFYGQALETDQVKQLMQQGPQGGDGYNELFSEVGGNGDGFLDTILNDEAATSISAESAPFADTFRPEGNLSDFDGEKADGTWMLEVRDDKNKQTGTLNNWSIGATQGVVLPDQSSAVLSDSAQPASDMVRMGSIKELPSKVPQNPDWHMSFVAELAQTKTVDPKRNIEVVLPN